MRLPLVIIAVTVAVLGAAAVARAAESPLAPSATRQKCGTHKVVFKQGFITVKATWRVSATGVPCANAVAVVRLLAGKPLPNYRRPYPGLYAGLRCNGGPEGAAWARTLSCKKAGTTKTITALTL